MKGVILKQTCLEIRGDSRYSLHEVLCSSYRDEPHEHDSHSLYLYFEFCINLCKTSTLLYSDTSISFKSILQNIPEVGEYEETAL